MRKRNLTALAILGSAALVGGFGVSAAQAYSEWQYPAKNCSGVEHAYLRATATGDLQLLITGTNGGVRADYWAQNPDGLSVTGEVDSPTYDSSSARAITNKTFASRTYGCQWP